MLRFTNLRLIFTLSAVLGSCTPEKPSASAPVPEVQKKTADSAQFKPFLCKRNEQILPSAEVDYLDVRRVVHDSGLSIVMHGKPCGATQAASCMSQLKELEHAPPPSAPDLSACPNRLCPEVVYALATQGDRAFRVESTDDLRTLLGTVDTPTEAWLLAMSNSRVGGLSCDDAETAGYREERPDFVLRMRWFSQTCEPIEKSEALFRVASTGQVTMTDRRTVSSEPGCVSN